jgi:tRNA modification GTPase
MAHVLASTGTTHVVELTPVGRAAVAVVVVDGPRAVAAVDACFAAVSWRTLADTPIGRIVLGRWRTDVEREDNSPSESDTGEEVIVCRRSADRVEVHCHGGTAALRAVVERLVDAGCICTVWPDWLRDRHHDPIRAAAHIALAEAVTERTAAILLDQINGALSAAVRAVLEDLTAQQWLTAAEKLDELLSRREFGRHLTAPWRVVLAGRPNVGKSSLLNALAGYGRAIVHHTPGTTRDVVTVSTAIDGWPIELADTAGLREADDAIEAAGVALARAALAGADLVLVVHDASAEDEKISEFELRARVLHVWNKSDLISAPPVDLPPACILTSAVTGAGVANLAAAIGQTLVPTPPAAGAAVPFTAGQLAALEAAHGSVTRHDGRAACEALQALLPE